MHNDTTHKRIWTILWKTRGYKRKIEVLGESGSGCGIGSRYIPGNYETSGKMYEISRNTDWADNFVNQNI